MDNTRKRILITDDEATIRQMLAASFDEEFACVEAASAEEALDKIQAQKFDLVLSDINMGRLSGLELVPLILKADPDTVIIMISGEQTIDSAIEALRAGAFDYIKKPFDLQDVEASVRRALDFRSLRETKKRYERDLEEIVRQRTAEIEHLSSHDPLTNLPNREMFRETLDQALATRADGQLLATMHLDLNRFKNINDTLGYATGDRLLCRFAERLKTCVRPGDIIARIGGDEFALFMTNLESTRDAISLSYNIREALARPFRVEGQELYITSSIGISMHPEDGAEAETLMKNAAAALYRAKEQGGNNYQFYTAEMNAQAHRRLSLENNLRRALEREEFTLHYQPKVDIDTGRIIGMESLVRWQQPGGAMVSPADFIPLAEQTGLIVPLGEWVMLTAYRQIRGWQDEGLSDLHVAVNISPRQFHNRDIVEMIAGALSETGLDPKYLEVELTESSIMKDVGYAVRTLAQIKELGVKVSIDDFGTGYSSLSYLKRLPLDSLKIDQSFVREATNDPDDASLVMAIITLAHNLRLNVIAEGVETNEQWKFLRLLRCDVAQGYLFSRPLAAESFKELYLKEQEARASDAVAV